MLDRRKLVTGSEDWANWSRRSLACTGRDGGTEAAHFFPRGRVKTEQFRGSESLNSPSNSISPSTSLSAAEFNGVIRI